MNHKSFKAVAVILVVALVGVQPAAYAGAVSSKTASQQAIGEREADLVLARTLFATDRVAQALAAEGLDEAQIRARIGALSTSDLVSLNENPAMLRSAGVSMTRKTWTIIGIAAGALVVGGLALQSDDGEDSDNSDDGED